MARVKLPSGISPRQLDDVFRAIIKLSPERERAVRLRLEGLTYKEIVEKIDAERPNGPRANVMWAQRSCKRAQSQLYAFEERLSQAKTSDSDNAYLRLAQDTPLPPRNRMCWLAATLHNLPKGVTARLYIALSNGDHMKQSRRGSSEPAEKTRGSHFCPDCTSTDWTYQAKNIGGHKNIRIYICKSCGFIITAANRRKSDIGLLAPHPQKVF